MIKCLTKANDVVCINSWNWVIDGYKTLPNNINEFVEAT